MDYEQLLPLGWQAFFQQQISMDDWENCLPARIVNFQRNEFSVQGEAGSLILPILSSMPAMTVGDWILVDQEKRFVRLLERSSCFLRKAAGSRLATQAVAANIDTVFVVCSLNQDFSLNRIERYLAVAHEARVEPVVVLSKADLCDNPEDYLEQVLTLDRNLAVLAVNGLDPESIKSLMPWCGLGRTVALMGSSGVGKSTLVNTLLGEQVQKTLEIREDDDEGRHTTTSRSLHQLANGGLLLDTPGMRELQLADCEDGIAATFADISELAKQCRFFDCQHQTEPHCAVLAAIQQGDLDERRLHSYRKLLREQAAHSASFAEKRARDRARGKSYRRIIGMKERNR